jgi:hypothetical protein
VEPGVVTALIGAASGALGLEVVRQWFQRGNRRLDDGAIMREKLWSRVADLETQIKEMQRDHKLEIQRLETAADEWQAKYVEIAGKFQVLLLEVEQLRAQVKHGAGTP